jgi:hypothetical protein
MNMQVPADIVCGKQSNHGDFYMPVSIRHLGDMPLYRAVAWWGLYLGREFNRDDISRAFLIEPRRASGILNYLTRSHADDDIAFKIRKRQVRGGHCQLSLHILAVSPTSTITVPRVKSGPRSRSLRADVSYDRQMARWLLSRPVADSGARFEAWRAACPVENGEC